MFGKAICYSDAPYEEARQRRASWCLGLVSGPCLDHPSIIELPGRQFWKRLNLASLDWAWAQGKRQTEAHLDAPALAAGWTSRRTASARIATAAAVAAAAGVATGAVTAGEVAGTTAGTAEVAEVAAGRR